MKSTTTSKKRSFIKEKPLIKGSSRNSFVNDLETVKFDVKPSFIKLYSKETKGKTRLFNEQKRINLILNDFSLKKRLGNLISFVEKPVLLPRNYELLIKKAIGLIKLLYYKEKPLLFKEILYEMNLEGITLNFSDILQFSYINKDFFIIKQVNLKDFTIEIDRNEDLQIILTQREEFIREFLLNRVKSLHFAFLRGLGEERDYLMYESQGLWHKDFNLEEIPDIPYKDIGIIYKDKSPLKEIINGFSLKERILNKVCSFFKRLLDYIKVF